MLHLITKKNKPTLLYTSSQTLAKFLTHEIIQNLGYTYSEDKIENKTVINCFNYNSIRNVTPKDDTIIISTVEISLWKEINPSLESIDLDNLPTWLKVVLISFLVFENKNLRKGFSSNFWINCLKLLSNNFFEIYFLYKVIGKMQEKIFDLSQESEKINLNKFLMYAILSYIEDNFSIGNDMGMYPGEKEKNRFLYFLLNPQYEENPYKFLLDVDLVGRIYYKYKILSDLSSKKLENLVISDQDKEIYRFLDVLSKLGSFSYLSVLDLYPNWGSDLVGNIELDDLLTIYPFSLIFCLLDKKVLILGFQNKYYLFEIKEAKNLNVNIKDFLGKHGLEIFSADLIHYTSQEIYSNFVKLIISSLKSNPQVGYKIISLPLLAYDYEYYNDKGFILMLLEKFEESKENFEKYLKVDEKDLLVNYNLAVLYWLNGDYKKALEIISQRINSLDTKRFFSVVIPIFPYRKKTLIFDVEPVWLYKISLANLLFLNGNKEEAKKLISKIDIQKVSYNREFLEYFKESLNFISNE
ncbi:MAG: tetratricopeptide repeat protein [bacterium]